MGKIAYRSRRSTRRKPRRNPTLLTLVNPGKAKPKAKPKKAKAKAKPKAKTTSAATKKQLAAAKKQVTAAKKQATAAKKAAKKATTTAKQIEKASAAVKRQLAAAKKSYIEVSGRQKKKTRSGTSKTGKPTKWKLPKRGFHRVSSRGRGPQSAEGYWRFQPNVGGTMRGRRRRVTRKPRRRRASTSWMSNPYFMKNKRKRKAAPRKARKSTKRVRKVAKRAAPKRKSVKRAAPKRKVRRSTRKRAAPKRKARRKSARKARRKTRRYKKNPLKGSVAMKQAAAGFAGFLFGRVVNNIMARHVVPMLPPSVAPMAPLLGTGAGLALAYYLPKKVKKIGSISLVKYQTAMLVGAGVAFLDVLLSTIAPSLPESVTAYLAPPGAAALPGGSSGFGSVWPQSFSHEAVGYASNPMLPGRHYGVQMGEYVRSPMGEYIQSGVGEYVSDNLDAGVISDGLYGDPGDDDLDIEVLD